MNETRKPRLRWFHVTPDRPILGLLPLEVFLFLSGRFVWFGFNEHKGWAVLIAVASVGVAALMMSLWATAGLLFRWRFQFSIGSLLVLVLVVAIPCSWMAVEMKNARRQKEAVRGIMKLGGIVSYDYQLQRSGNPLARAGQPGPAWLRDLLGEDFFVTVVEVNFAVRSVTDADLEHLKGLTQLHRTSL